jgi:hypothetical protein
LQEGAVRIFPSSKSKNDLGLTRRRAV